MIVGIYEVVNIMGEGSPFCDAVVMVSLHS